MLSARVPAPPSPLLLDKGHTKGLPNLTISRRRAQSARCQRINRLLAPPPSAQDNKQAQVQAQTEGAANQGMMSMGLTKSEILELQRVLALGPTAVDIRQQEEDASDWGTESGQEITEEVGFVQQ